MKIGSSRFSKGGYLKVVGQYADGSPALRLFAEEHAPAQSTPEMTVTVRTDDPAPEGHVWLKTWGEADGMPEALEKAGAVELLLIFIKCGYSRAQLARLLQEFPE